MRIRAKNSGLPTACAIGRLKRNSFCSGSRMFSKALVFDVVKQLMIAVVNDSLRSFSSTLAVSSWSLYFRVRLELNPGKCIENAHQTKIASRAVTCQYGSDSNEI